MSDGTFTEVLNGEMQQGQEVVTTMVTGLEPKTATPGGANANNPLMGPQRGARAAAGLAVVAAALSLAPLTHSRR